VFGLDRVALFGFLLLSVSGIGCLQPQGKENVEYGFLEGEVNIGPLCPVMRDPPDPNCQVTPEILKAWPIGIYAAESKVKVQDLKYKDGGPEYSAKLKDGRYIIKFEGDQRIFGGNLPLEAIIKSGETTILDISIDTGIR
jgi:hypothetical protein